MPLPDPTEHPTLSCDEAAVLLGVGRSTIYRAVKTGDLPAITLGRAVRIPTAPLLALLGHEVPPPAARLLREAN